MAAACESRVGAVEAGKLLNLNWTNKEKQQGTESEKRAESHNPHWASP